MHKILGIIRRFLVVIENVTYVFFMHKSVTLFKQDFLYDTVVVVKVQKLGHEIILLHYARLLYACLLKDPTHWGMRFVLD